VGIAEWGGWVKPVQCILLYRFEITPEARAWSRSCIYYDRFGWHTREEYETFTRVCGYDLLQWSGYPVLAAVREFIMLTWMVLKAAESGRNIRRGAEADSRAAYPGAVVRTGTRSRRLACFGPQRGPSGQCLLAVSRAAYHNDSSHASFETDRAGSSPDHGRSVGEVLAAR
jgi:hypothetical protein